MCFHLLEAVLFIAVLYGMAFGQGIVLMCAFVCVMHVEVDCTQTYTTHLHPAHACTSFAMVYWTMYKAILIRCLAVMVELLAELVHVRIHGSTYSFIS